MFRLPVAADRADWGVNNMEPVRHLVATPRMMPAQWSGVLLGLRVR